MTASLSRARVCRGARRRKDILPHPFTSCVRILLRECVRQVHAAITLRDVFGMEPAHAEEMYLQIGGYEFGKHRDAVLSAFAIADKGLMTLEIDILYPEAHRLE